jgi:hypothetical protein
LVVQGAGNYRSDDSGSRLGGFIHYRHHAVLGGGRLSTRQQRGKCFAQMLVGVSVKTESPDRVSGFGYFNSVDPAIQPGVGMCVFLSRRFGLELGVDYRWVGGDSSDDSNLVLLHLGVTFGFRRRV